MPDNSVTTEPAYPPGDQQTLEFVGRCAGCARVAPINQFGETNVGGQVCATCAEQLPTCARCELTIASRSYRSDTGRPICDQHVNYPRYEYVVCDRCEAVTRSPAQTEYDGSVCLDCRGLYVECDRCGIFIRPGHTLCEDCDGEAEQDDLFSDWFGSPSLCSCSDCRETSNLLIYDYGYKPLPEFHGDGPVWLGLELEVDVHRRNVREAAELANQHLGQLGYLKEDGSIDGFEIVTHPMSYDWALNNFPWRLLNDLGDAGAEVHENTGIHVHISRTGFKDPCHVYRWLKFIYRNERQVKTIARRSSGEWAEFYPSDRDRAKHVAKGDSFGDRHVAVNTCNSTTFELRVFASSLNKQEVQAALAFAAASVEYTRHLKVPDVIHGGWTWAAFTDWLADREEYAPLRAELEDLACVC